VKQENRDGPKYHTDGSKFCRANSPVQLLRARFGNKIDKTYNTTAPSGNGSLSSCHRNESRRGRKPSEERVIGQEGACDGRRAYHQRWQEGDVEELLDAQVASCGDRAVGDHPCQGPGLR
jgi:hypothetical protein